MKPKVSCIIVTWNSKYLPRVCVEALQRSKCDFDFEIIVVDNDSQDESLSYLKKMHEDKEIILVQAGANLGYGKGNNLGVKHAKGEYVVILNPDVGVEEDTLQKLVAYMDEHPKVGLVGPQLYFFNGEIQDSCRRFMRPMDLIIKRTPLKRIPILAKRVKEYLMVDYDKKIPQEVDMVTGACFIMRKEIFEKMGGFDPRYFMFMEDADLCRTLWKNGYKVVYYPHARALHYHKRLSEGGLFSLLRKKVFWIHLNSARKYFMKWRKR